MSGQVRMAGWFAFADGSYTVAIQLEEVAALEYTGGEDDPITLYLTTGRVYEVVMSEDVRALRARLEAEFLA